MVVGDHTGQPPGASNQIKWHAEEPDDVARLLGSGPDGLTSAVAAERLQQYGPNQLEEAPPTNSLLVLLRQFQSPLIYILLLAAVVTLLLREFIDATVITFALFLNAIIGFIEERQAEISIRSLIRLTSPHARVIRSGQEFDIESRELVPGDLVLLESGVRVPADLRLVNAAALLVDESLLTGESLTVRKQTDPVRREAVLGDQENMVFAGTVVTSGRGKGYVVETGIHTQIGNIATEVGAEGRVETPLQRRLAHFSRVIVIVIGIVSVLAFAVGLVRGLSLNEIFLTVVAMAIGSVPEALPVVFTITLAIGVRRMASRNAIVRRLPAVEALGSTTVIGTDKTGTLTENRMVVRDVWAGGDRYQVGRHDRHSASLDGDDPLSLTLLAGVLPNEATISTGTDGVSSTGDPTEVALLVAADRLGIDPEEARSRYPVQLEIPFESERQYSSVVCEVNGKDVQFVKGAPERLLTMCDRMLLAGGEVPLDADRVHAASLDLADRGLRVLAMAHGPVPQVLEAAREPQGLVFLGLQGMLDPPRERVREAIEMCHAAGIRVVMITGDHAGTARSIARDLNIATDRSLMLTGEQMAHKDEEALRDAVLETDIYARATPRDKLRVVQALQHHGQVVAITGDGVNDAPALRAADIGVAMGKSGTDIAREASDMVLTDDNFVSITHAIEEGRVAFENVRKVTFFLISTAAAEILTIIVSLMLGWPLPLVATQIIWLNLVTNGLQDVALAFEPGEEGLMQRKPHLPREGIVSALLWERTVVTGLVMALGTLYMFDWARSEYDDLGLARTIALTMMVLFQAVHIGNARSTTRSAFRVNLFSNPFLLICTAAALAIHVAALSFGPAQYVLRVQPIPLAVWPRLILLALTVLIVVEIHKLLRRPAE